MAENDSTPSERDSQLAKLDDAIRRAVDQVIVLTRATTSSETLYYLYCTTMARHVETGNLDVGAGAASQVVGNKLVDVWKWLLAVGLKFCGRTEDGELNWPLTGPPKAQVHTVPLAEQIDARYESRAILQLFPFDEVPGRPGLLRSNLKDALEANPEIKVYWEYFQRLESSTWRMPVTGHEAFLENFESHFGAYAGEFQAAMGLPLTDYVDIVRLYCVVVQERLKAAVEHMPTLPNGNIDPIAGQTFILHIEAYTFDDDKMLDIVGQDSWKMIQRLEFKPEDFNPYELKYHAIDRAPIIRLNRGAHVVNPQLLLDSLYPNTHFSMLESAQVLAEGYKAKYATEFLNRVAAIAVMHGFKERTREWDLFEGKTQIGDLDLWLENEHGEALLVEAKAHALPMDVYFRDLNAVKAHLARTQKDWERKVMRRREHLKKKENRQTIGLGDSYSYVIVSRFPEIISHFSDLLVLTESEFALWLADMPRAVSFEEYANAHPPNSVADAGALAILDKAGFGPLRMSQENQVAMDESSSSTAAKATSH